jgi:hypothetical protein
MPPDWTGRQYRQSLRDRSGGPNPAAARDVRPIDAPGGTGGYGRAGRPWAGGAGRPDTGVLVEGARWGGWTYRSAAPPPEHSLCDGILIGPSVSLRHLLAMTISLADGPRASSICHDIPFFLEDGAGNPSWPQGPSQCRSAGKVIGAVPIEEISGGLHCDARPGGRYGQVASVRGACATGDGRSRGKPVPPWNSSRRRGGRISRDASFTPIAESRSRAEGPPAPR